MVWIEAAASYETYIRATRDDVATLIQNIAVIGPMFPGVDRIEDLGDGRYRWLIKERRTLGISFVGNYVSEYRVEGNSEVSWTTIEGNMKTRGAWRMSGPDGHVLVRVEAINDVDAPVPRFLKKPAQLFAIKETRDGIKAQLDNIKAALESPSRAP